MIASIVQMNFFVPYKFFLIIKRVVDIVLFICNKTLCQFLILGLLALVVRHS